MNLGRVHFSIRSLRLLAVAALASEAASHSTRFSPQTSDFLSGLTVGMLLVLTAGLFYAPKATVERMPHEDAPLRGTRGGDDEPRA